MKGTGARKVLIKDMPWRAKVAHFRMAESVMRCPIHNDTATNSSADRDIGTHCLVPTSAPAGLGQGCAVDIGIKTNGQAKFRLEPLAKIRSTPTGLRCVGDKAPGLRITIELNRSETGYTKGAKGTEFLLSFDQPMLYGAQSFFGGGCGKSCAI